MEIVSWEYLAFVGIGLIIFEVLVPTFFFFPIGISFLMASVAAVFTNSQTVIVAVFAAGTIINIVVFKKFLQQMYQKPETMTNVEGLIGQECEVIREISPDSAGYVKLYGDEWKALSRFGDVFPVGTRVVIVKVDGNKVHVEPIH